MKLRQLSIGTFNLYNLNEPDLPIYTGRGWTPAEYNLKIDGTQRTIRQLHPDIFGLQELRHNDHLNFDDQARAITDAPT